MLIVFLPPPEEHPKGEILLSDPTIFFPFLP